MISNAENSTVLYFSITEITLFKLSAFFVIFLFQLGRFFLTFSRFLYDLFLYLPLLFTSDKGLKNVTYLIHIDKPKYKTHNISKLSGRYISIVLWLCYSLISVYSGLKIVAQSSYNSISLLNTVNVAFKAICSNSTERC